MIKSSNNTGFTLLELVFVIILLSILSVGAILSWPKDMKREADEYAIRHAIRLAQHIAMTRPFEKAHPWGFVVENGGHSYSIQKKGTSTYAKDPTNGRDIKGIALMGGATLICDKDGIWFDRFGTPLDYTTLSPITAEFHCRISGGTITIYPETGYVE